MEKKKRKLYLGCFTICVSKAQIDLVVFLLIVYQQSLLYIDSCVISSI